jgi:hypothetical protein
MKVARLTFKPRDLDLAVRMESLPLPGNLKNRRFYEIEMATEVIKWLVCRKSDGDTNFFLA